MTPRRAAPRAGRDQWLGKNSDVAVPTPVVDEIKSMTGATVTIFQKTPSGDFLRVATNVQAASGARAIGTYIPVTNPDGQAQPGGRRPS